eukprot:tig00021135_g18944.t1
MNSAQLLRRLPALSRVRPCRRKAIAPARAAPAKGGDPSQPSAALRGSRSVALGLFGARASAARALPSFAAPQRVFHASALRRNDEAASSAAGPADPKGEKVTGAAERMEFQAETRQLLDIVAHSLYTDKEVFVRELISNASDALEKARYVSALGQDLADATTAPMQVEVYTDEQAQTITILDHGIGMTHDELIQNLGTIARSGSKAFLQKLRGADGGAATPGDTATNIIGQFGVGFYSAFMVADKVTVFSRSATPGSPGYCWTSDGTGTFEIAPAEGVQRGTKIVVHLKESEKQFAKAGVVQDIIKKYSNFISFPIYLNAALVNLVSPLWMKDKNQVTEEQYVEFYRFVANAVDEPRMRLHFAADSPINLRVLLFVPREHNEKYGFGRMESGVSLYSRKVLIKGKASILPEWLRFVKGVVDSEDIPLNISRENMQDSSLIRRIGTTLTKRLLKHFQDEARGRPALYDSFFNEYNIFLKEGIVADPQHRDELAKLLRYESSKKPDGMVISLEDYVKGMKEGQKNIYYLVASSRAAAEASPYLDALRADDIEVLFCYQALDEFVMSHLNQFDGKALKSCEDPDVEAKKTEKSEDPSVDLNKTEAQELADWILKANSDKLASVKVSERVTSAPAIVVGHGGSTMRNVMRILQPDSSIGGPGKQQLEINPHHVVCYRLFRAKHVDPELARKVAEQMVDNAMIAAGLMEDPRVMVSRLNSLLEAALPEYEEVTSTGQTGAPGAGPSASSSAGPLEAEYTEKK